MAPKTHHGGHTRLHEWPKRHGCTILNPKGLLDLPVELRTQIYSYLLPFVKRDWWLGVPLEEANGDDYGYNDPYQKITHSKQWYEDHRDGHGSASFWDLDLDGGFHPKMIDSRTTTAFMRTSHLIYLEAAEYLYSHGEFGVRLDRDSSTMLGQYTALGSDTMPYFGAFQFIKKLDVEIFTHGCAQEIIQIQSQVTHLFEWCRGPSNLRQVRVSFGDGFEKINKRLMKHELFYHSKRDFLRQHVVAFLLDPLRNLHLSTGCEASIKCGYFKLSAFKSVPKLIANTCLTESPTADYESIAAYADAVDNLRQVAKSYCEERSLDHDRLTCKEHAEVEILATLIRGDVQSFSAKHDKFVAQILILLNAPTQFSKHRREEDTPPQSKPLTDEEATSFGRALAKLAETRPKDLMLSSSGAVHVENAITLWQAAHKVKFMAHKKEMREFESERTTKRIKLDGARSTWENDLSDSEHEITDDEQLYAENYCDGKHDYYFMQNEGEDSDGLSWCAEADDPWYWDEDY